jgi:alpha-D-ribose 1-methylphosphonate 5-triphosphate synthase subunit PhnH
MPETQQRVFRELAAAFSRPGEVRDLGALIGGADGRRAVLAVLMDGEVTLADPHQQVAAADWPMLQAEPGPVEASRYVAVSGREPADIQPALGTLESPEFGATLLVAVERLGEGPMALEVSGPGVRGTRQLSLSGLNAAWVLRRAEWTAAFPLGVDMILMDERRVAALPRTARLLMTRGGD